jgi:ParB family transcriptional regulator, chromosome partitioning protein
MPNNLAYLDIDQLQPNPFQPRDKIKPESIKELTESIKQHGIIEPLSVAQTPAGYQIIAGERRWRAAKAAGLDKVPVIISKTTRKQMLEIALVENVQRRDLNAIERAKGFQQLMRDFEFTIKDLTEKISKSEPYISNSLRLLSLPDAIKDGVIDGVISEGHARALAGLESESMQIKCFRKIVKENASVRRAEQIVRQVKQKEQKSRDEQWAQEGKDGRITQVEKVLKKEFQSPSLIDLRRSNKQTRLTITLHGNPETTEKDLEVVLNKLQGEKLQS